MASDDELLRIALAQVNPTVGDIEGNARIIRDRMAEARDGGARLVLFPELCLTGYPPEDLLLKPHFLTACGKALDQIADEATGIVALVGFAERAGDVHNSLAVVCDGRVHGVYRKLFLPNYGVFDEYRYFQVGQGPAMIDLDGVLIGLTVCEDIWEPGPPATTEALAGATVIVNASASPYHRGKGTDREAMLAQRARDSLAIVAFCNMVGGQDELVFDGHSLVIDERGETIARGPQFDEALVLCDVDPAAAASARLRDSRHRPAARDARPDVPVIATLAPEPPSTPQGPVGGAIESPLADDEEVYAALVIGLRDYVEKNGFDRVVLGLSGGIDSALVALVAADALGPERVSCVVMPSPHSAAETQADAREVARNLGADLIELPIGELMETYAEALAEPFAGTEPGVAEENVQARIRGNLLMALSNKFGWLVLTTGNKSEMSVGYSTLYGDMAGGFAVIKDVPKTLVYRLVQHRCRVAGDQLVPASVLERPPSAELRPDQIDQDSLPSYDILDRILVGYVENDQGHEELVRQGLPSEVVADVIRRVDGSEYKRRQAPPGIRISSKAFGRDRRMPITNRFGD